MLCNSFSNSPTILLSHAAASWFYGFLPAEVNGVYGGGLGHNQPGEADGETSQQRSSLWTEQYLNRRIADGVLKRPKIEKVGQKVTHKPAEKFTLDQTKYEQEDGNELWYRSINPPKI